MNRLIKYFGEPSIPLWKYCLIMFPVGMVPSYIFYGTAQVIANILGWDVHNHLMSQVNLTFKDMIWIIVISPIVETFILAGFIVIIQKMINNRFIVSLILALLFGALHGIFGALWFFGAAWPFFVFAYSYSVWREISFSHAIMAAWIPHLLHNTTSFSIMYYVR